MGWSSDYRGQGSSRRGWELRPGTVSRKGTSRELRPWKHEAEREGNANLGRAHAAGERREERDPGAELEEEEGARRQPDL
jgi:hypothetical protein